MRQFEKIKTAISDEVCSLGKLSVHDVTTLVHAYEANTAIVASLTEALEKIERWFGEFPETGETWQDGSPMSYAACYGSNGERDYMRSVARAALSLAKSETPQ